MNTTRRCGHPLGYTSWCHDCTLAEARESGEFSIPPKADAASAPELSEAVKRSAVAVLGWEIAHGKRPDCLDHEGGGN